MMRNPTIGQATKNSHAGNTSAVTTRSRIASRMKRAPNTRIGSATLKEYIQVQSYTSVNIYITMKKSILFFAILVSGLGLAAWANSDGLTQPQQQTFTVCSPPSEEERLAHDDGMVRDM